MGRRPTSIPTEKEWREALAEIEGPYLNYALNVVSSYRHFFKAVAQEPAARKLYSAMLALGEAREEVLGRLQDLAALEIDRRYEHPKDTALAVLLWLIYFSSPEYQLMAADIVDRAPQCWYAKKLARAILTPSPIASGTTDGMSDKPHNEGSPPGAVMLTWHVERDARLQTSIRTEASTST